MIRHPPKLRTFITGLILLVIIPSVLLTLYNAREQHRNASQTAQNQLTTLVQLVVSEQDQLVAGSRQLLLTLSHLPVVHEVVADPARAEQCQQVLSNLLSPHPYYYNFGVADTRGNMHCSALDMPHSVNIRDRLYFQRSMANNGFGIGEFQIGRITGKPAINLSYPIIDADGKVQGIVFTALSLDWLGRLNRNAPLAAGTTLQVIDGNGRLLSQYPASQTASETGISTTLYRQILRHPGKQSLVLRDPGDVRRFYAYAPLLDEAGGIYVTANVAYETLTAEVNAQLLRNIILLSLLTVLIFTLAWIYSHSLFLHRIQALIRGAERLSHGQLEARSGVMHGSDELGYLAQAFDSMAESLQGHQRELQLTSESLQHSNRALQALSACNRTLIHATDVQQLLDMMCQIIVDNGGYNIAWIGKAREATPLTIDVQAHAGMTDANITVLTCSLDASEAGCIPAVTAIRENRVVVWRTTRNESSATSGQGDDRPCHAVIALPLRFDSEEGVLNIYAEEDHAFDSQEVRLLQEMAEDIAFGIHTLADRARRQSAEAHIHHLAYYDPLTDLPNRYLLEERLTQLIGASCTPLAFLMINIKRFNEINNSIGYSHADTLLKMIGPRLCEILPPDTFIARTGGDIFAVLITDCNHSAALSAAREIQSVSKQEFRLADFNLNIDVSIGISLYPEHGTESVTLIRRASLAMHMANDSPDDIFTYDPRLDADGPRRLTLAADLRHAIESADGQLQLHLQPKVDIHTRCVISAEALCRWQHPEHGAISPAEFIPLAEHTGLIVPLTMWVLQAAIEQIQLLRQLKFNLPIAVNLSTRNLYQTDLITHIKHLCRTNDIPMHLLELELTESALMQEPEQCQATLQALHELGIMLYIDDYGTGYSSLSYIKRLPMKAIKIDMSFIKDMQHSNEAQTIVKSTIAMAHELGMLVVAEGVENAFLFDKLAAMGCDQAQGYYIARPQDSNALIDWLNDSGWQAESLTEPEGSTPGRPD